MTQHTITHTDDLYACPACDWRAVQCHDGRIVQTVAGAAGHDHLGQAIGQRNQALIDQSLYAARILARVQQHMQQGQLSAAQGARLSCAIMGEYR